MNSGSSSPFMMNEHKDMVFDAKTLDCGCEAILFWRNIYNHITSSQLLLKDRGFHS